MLPALFVLLGRRVGRAPVAPRRRRRPEAGRLVPPGARRDAAAGARRPGYDRALLFLASPTPNVRWSGIDATVLPRSQSSRVVADLIARDFPAAHGGSAITVVATAPPRRVRAGAYAARLGQVPGVTLTRGPRRLAAPRAG